MGDVLRTLIQHLPSAQNCLQVVIFEPLHPSAYTNDTQLAYMHRSVTTLHNILEAPGTRAVELSFSQPSHV